MNREKEYTEGELEGAYYKGRNDAANYYLIVGLAIGICIGMLFVILFLKP